MVTKNTRRYLYWFDIVAIVSIVVFVVAPQAQAQTTEDIATAPIECFTRTSTDAVRVGEPFTLILTCAVLETASTLVVPDESVLDPAVLQLAPFEVIGGTRPDDVRTSSRRLFQYEYRVRFIGEQFGREVMLPGTTITYRVQNRGAGGATIEGRERTYLLPSIQIRILSLLPAGATELREPAPATFAAIQQRRVRANAMRIGSTALLVLSGAMVLWALVGALRRPDTQRQATLQLPSDTAVIRAVRRELAAIRRDRAASGWTPELTARALAPLRAAGTLAAGRHLSMTPQRDGTARAAGQLVVRGPLPRRVAALVSGAAAGSGVDTAARHAELHDALDRFTRAAYGRDAAEDSALDEAMNAAERATDRLAAEFSWPRVTLRRLFGRRASRDQQAWTH
jgi:hypothetical protein